MRKQIIGGLAILLTASMSTDVEAYSTTVDCGRGQKITAALKAGYDDIKVRGTCNENVEIRDDDVTILGLGGATLIGQVFVNGANRVTLVNLAVQGVTLNPPDSTVLVARGGSAVLDHVTVRNAVTGVIATGNSYLEIVNGSLFENNTGRGIAVELGAAGAIVYVTGRTTRTRQSEYARPETIEDTADLVSAAGGQGIAVRVDHLVADEVRALAGRICAEQGRLDILVNDVWGGEKLFEWNKPVWGSTISTTACACSTSASAPT